MILFQFHWDRKNWPNCKSIWLKFRRSLVRIHRGINYFNESFRCSPWPLHGNTGIVMQIKPLPLPSTLLTIHCSLTVISSTLYSLNSLTVLLNKQFINSVS
jgi:hypothetical protein